MQIFEKYNENLIVPALEMVFFVTNLHFASCLIISMCRDTFLKYVTGLMNVEPVFLTRPDDG
jgi:hypothetical protein